jgi:hypothetical protein
MEGHDGEDSTVRAAWNQSLFRTVNERLEGLAETLQFVSEMSNFACECADLKCMAMMDLTLDEYEAIRGGPNQFAVLPGHVDHGVERVLSENERYTVVAKLGEGAEVARENDPRRSSS